MVITCVALVLRLVYLRQFAALPFFDEPVGESAVHLKLAREIAGGAWLPTRPFFYASVLYPYFLAGTLAAGGGLLVVCLVQVIAGVALVPLLAAIATRLHGRAAGLATATLTALYGPFAFMEADVVGIVWALLGLVVALLLLVRWSDPERPSSRTPFSLVRAGIALGAAAAERPNLVLLVPVAAAWCAWRSRAGRVRPAAALAFGAAAPIALVVLLNFVAAGQWIPLATSRGLNLYIGFNPAANGTYDEPWSPTPSSRRRASRWRRG
jgi:4-amino-4-deoxy-L-arabinose transferase-like glycosyltransferase